VEHNKSIIESLFNNLARIILVTILFLCFRYTTRGIVMSIDFIARLSWFGQIFYLGILEVVVLLLIFKYGFNKESKITKVDEKKIKINMLDIFIFLFMGLLLKNILFEGFVYLEGITNADPSVESIMAGALNDAGRQMTNLDTIYIVIAGVILGPIVEELFFRKGVVEYFSDKEVTSRSIILISGISFGLTHIGSPAILAHSIVVGIIFAVMYATTKNVIYPIIGHGLNNLMQNITSIFIENGGMESIEAVKFEIRGAIIISLVLLVITCIISYIKRRTIISSDFKKRLVKVFTD
jgi:membrane protease YdiL (CAAX protease family)